MAKPLKKTVSEFIDLSDKELKKKGYQVDKIWHRPDDNPGSKLYQIMDDRSCIGKSSFDDFWPHEYDDTFILEVRQNGLFSIIYRQGGMAWWYIKRIDSSNYELTDHGVSVVLSVFCPWKVLALSFTGVEYDRAFYYGAVIDSYGMPTFDLIELDGFTAHILDENSPYEPYPPDPNLPIDPDNPDVPDVPDSPDEW